MAHLEQVIAHAERELSVPADSGHAQLASRLPLYRRFLKIENHRLRLSHQAGGGGREICRRRVGLLDVFLRHLFLDACNAAPSSELHDRQLPAMLAIGGYGRGELNPFSDVDILFLHDFSQHKVPAPVNELIKQILYVLWDIGFKVGHATRSIREACEHANLDNVSKTALLESRFIVGREALFATFKERFERACVRGHERAYLAWRQEDQRARHLKHGNTVFLQEPNIKSSPGGLRDYHNLLWSAYFKERALNISQLTEKQFLNDSERRTLDRAYDFLLRVRTDLHYLGRRAVDTLSINFQGQIANRFQYPQKNSLRRTEAFMRDYYHHARAISLITETLFERLTRDPSSAPGNGLKRLFALGAAPAAQRLDGFLIQGGLIYPETRDVFNHDPFRLLRVFDHAQVHGWKLSSELQQLVRRRLHLVNRTFQYARAAREVFLGLLARPGKVGRTLRAMHEVDLLGAYLPEFGELTCLVQHEFFHRYTADEHTLVCIEKLDAVLDPANTRVASYRQLFKNLQDPAVLYLALLLHDTGKATSARHHAEASALFAQKVAARLQLSPERRRSLILLVDHHLTLSSTAQRRNLDDPDTIIEFAQIVKDSQNLDALMLLTLADGQGVGNEAWSDWKESLVWQLYRAARRYLAEGEAFHVLNKRAREDCQRAVAAALDPSFAEEIDAHFQLMPERYFETFDAAAITEHLLLIREFLARRYAEDSPETGLAAAFRWQPRLDRGHTECWVCTWERRGLLAKIAGSFSTAGLNILSADIYTRDDNIVFDVFRVTLPNMLVDIEARDFAAVETALSQALLIESFDFGPLLLKPRRRRRQPPSGFPELDFPTRVVITNEATSRHTLIEVQTPDRLGLLYDLLRALGRLGVNVVLSRIATEMGAAIDSFYLTNSEGHRITDPALLKKIQGAVQEAAPKARPAG